MAVVFLLGPSEWATRRRGDSPMQVRREMGRVLASGGHHVILMEDVEDLRGEDLIEKFDRILHTGVTDVVVYWPARAKMQTTYDELILLRERAGDPQRPNVWILHHEDVARIEEDRFQVKERGGRSRYLEAVARLGVRPLPWIDHAELLRIAHLLASEL